ncbi:MAG TPA: hypothetical protein ENK11_10765, partial [Phycisphaerales bacterium]|nr:hypothetical protein [Phycisphaerales bacterium]
LFEGTLILISHDRALLDACCDRLLVLDGAGNVEVFIGTYSEWHEKEVAGARGGVDPTKSPPRGRRPGLPTSSGSAKPSPAQTPKRKSKWSWMRLEQLEEKITQIEARLRAIDTELGDPDVWRDLDRANALTDERDELKIELEGVEAEWLRKAE